MTKEWRAFCKDCGKGFGYSHSVYEQGLHRGMSRQERCPECLAKHRRAVQTAGTGYFFDDPPLRTPAGGGALGRLSHMPRIHKPVEIPAFRAKYKFGITAQDIKKVYEALLTKQVLVVVGPTGSGKSTYLPSCLLVPPDDIDADPQQFVRHGQIVVTQPRIQATIKTAQFIAEQLHGSSLGPGHDVGYKYSQENLSDSRNKLLFTTDGTLINWIISGQLDRLSLIMIDEAHERSLNIDLILGLLRAQLARYPHLKLIIASATIDADKFSDYFGGPERVGMLEFKGIQHDVKVFLRNGNPSGDFGSQWEEVNRSTAGSRGQGFCARNNWGDAKQIWIEGVSETCLALARKIARGEKMEGDILAFLPTERSINSAVSTLRCQLRLDPVLSDIDVFPLHSKLPMEEQNLSLRSKAEATAARAVKKMEEAANGTTAPCNLTVFVRHTNDNKIVNDTVASIREMICGQPYQDNYEIISAGQGMTVAQLSDACQPGKGGKHRVIVTTYDYMQDMPLEYGHRIVDRRIIVATNVAETSLTVDGIVYVVDSGLITKDEWNADKETVGYASSAHSQAGCRQRWGRAGRIMDGEAYGLYTSEQFKSFEPYTIPEITRKQLDQVVLSAKAAGIDDICSFEWLESLAENPEMRKELGRAEQSLKHRKALDDDGDMTAYGNEIRSFGVDPQAAELIITADRFNCAVEMCTLVPMMRCNLFGGLLKWDDQWDVVTQNAVQRIHKSLLGVCRDDIELYFKLYEAWLNADQWEGGRHAWAATFMVNDAFFEELIHPEREELIASLSKHKKQDERRPLDFDLLDRIRVILAYCLPQNCFVRDSSSTYRQWGSPSSLRVDIDSDSVVALTRDLPEAIVCYNRTGTLQGIRASKVAEVCADFLPRLSDIKSDLELASFVAEVTRERRSGELKRSMTKSRVFVDQIYPLDWHYQAEYNKDQSGNMTVRLGKLVKRASSVLPRVRPTQEMYVIGRPGDADSDLRIPNRRFAGINEQDDSETVVSPSPEVISDGRIRLRMVNSTRSAGSVRVYVNGNALPFDVGPGTCSGYFEIPDARNLEDIHIVFSDSRVSLDISSTIAFPASADAFTIVILQALEGDSPAAIVLRDGVNISGHGSVGAGLACVRAVAMSHVGLSTSVKGTLVAEDYCGVDFREESLRVGNVLSDVGTDVREMPLGLISDHFYTIVPSYDHQSQSWGTLVLEDGYERGSMHVQQDYPDVTLETSSSEHADLPEIVQVIGHEINRTGRPVVRVSPVTSDRFDDFLSEHSVGDVVRVKIVACNEGDSIPWLLVEDIATGYRTIMDGRNVAFNLSHAILKYVIEAGEIDVIVELIDIERRFVDVSRLPLVEEDLEAKIQEVKWDGYAGFLGQEKDKVYWALWHPDALTGIVHGAVSGVAKKFDRSKDYEPQEVRFPDNSVVLLAKAPAGLLMLLDREPWRSRIIWDETTASLQLNEPMRYTERALLLAQSDEPSYRVAIDELYRKSNRLELAMRRDSISRPRGSVIRGSFFGIYPNSAIGCAVVDGVEVEVIIQRRGHAGWRETKDVREVLRRGQEMQLAVIGETKDGSALLVRAVIANDPMLKYSSGNRVSGTVTKVYDDRIEVEIEPGVSGIIARDKAAWCVVPTREIATVGHSIRCEVESVDLASRKLKLSCRLRETDPLLKYAQGATVDARVVGMTETDVVFSIEPGIRGLLHKSSVPSSRVQEIKERVSMGRQLRLKVLGVDNLSHRRIHLALQGSSLVTVSIPPSLVSNIIEKQRPQINSLMLETNTFIRIVGDTAQILGGEHEVREAKRRIEQMVNRQL